MRTIETLLRSLQSTVILPAEQKAKELSPRSGDNLTDHWWLMCALTRSLGQNPVWYQAGAKRTELSKLG